MDPRDASHDSPAPSRPKKAHRLDLEIIVDDEMQEYALIGDLDELDEIFGELDRQPGPALPAAGELGQAHEDPERDDRQASAAAPADGQRELARRDAEIAELQAMLNAMKPLGLELAELQSARAVAEQHVLARESELTQLREELRVLRLALETAPREAAGEPTELLALRAENEALRARIERMKGRQRSLQRRGREREGVLARERKRHAATRAKLAEAKRLASERWKALRSRKR